jgi:hypothetical protein
MTAPTPQNPATGQQGDPAGQAPPAPVTAPALGSQPQPPAPVQPEPQKPADEPLGEAGLRALQAERDKVKELAAELKTLEPLKELAAKLGAVPPGEKSDADKIAEQMAELQKQFETERGLRLKLEVAKAKNLTDAQAVLLVGSTAEELNAHADQLLAAFPATSTSDGQRVQPQAQPAGPKPDLSQGARGPVDLNAQIAAAEAAGNTRESIRLKAAQVASLRQ